MFICYEYASCVFVAMIVAALAVGACAVYPLLKSGRGILERNMNHLMHQASYQPATMWARRVRKP